MDAGLGAIEKGNREAGFWLELKEAWRALTPQSVVVPLSREAEDYFKALTFRYFSSVLGKDGQLLRFGLQSPSPEEAWATVFRELYLQRTSGGARILDDIYLRAFQAVAKAGLGNSVEGAVGYLKKNFQLRLRDVVRSWARDQLGSLGKKTYLSLDDSQGPAGSASHSAHEFIPANGTPADDPEWRDIQRCGSQIASSLFLELDDIRRTCVLLVSVRIGLNHPIVVAEMKRGKSILADHERKTRESLIGRCRVFDPGLDPQGLRDLEVAAYQQLRSMAENWFFTEKRTGPLFTLVMERAPQSVSTFQQAIS